MATPSRKRLKIAAATFTYNESVNLPLWVKHYGALCGEENLYVADRGSDDGSLARLGRANLLKLPRREFDELEKTDFVNRLQAELLKSHDAVICTDCDEFLVADPETNLSLRDYIETMPDECVRAIGVDVIHIIDCEYPIDLARPILSQREYGRFGSPSCKPLLSKTPLRWLPGFHSCDRDVGVDPSLVLFHLKLMDYGVACNRQKINLDTIWSQRSLEMNFGAHHRQDLPQFVEVSFLQPAQARRINRFHPFSFVRELDSIRTRTTEAHGFWQIPMDIYKLVTIPRRFSAVL